MKIYIHGITTIPIVPAGSAAQQTHGTFDETSENNGNNCVACFWFIDHLLESHGSVGTNR